MDRSRQPNSDAPDDLDGSFDPNGPDDVGQGRLLPTTSVDQYAATLGRWFGLSDAQLLDVLPHLSHYNASARTLGFV